MAVNYGSVPFDEQLSFFRKKLNIPTNHWRDIYTKEHDWAFMVAGANRDDLLADFRRAIDSMIAEGKTIESFRKDFDAIVAKHGWDYNGGREWRTRVIYETNLYQSYNAGRYEQLKANRATLPYLQYRHSHISEHPRANHLAWDQLVLRADDPWWDTHFPQNAWGCKCYVVGVSEAGLKEMGKAKPDTAPAIEYETRLIGQRHPDGPVAIRVPKGVEPGFEYAPGQARLHNAIPPERPEPPMSGAAGGFGLPNTRPIDELPDARTFSEKLLPAGLPDDDYANDFLNRFGASANEPVVFTDVTGSRLVVGAELFRAREKAEDSNVVTPSRNRFMRLLAQAVKEPDEIWVRIEYPHNATKPVVRRRYIARFLVEGEPTPALAVWEHSNSGWSGMTVFPSEQDVNDMRVGVRVYRRQ